MIDDLLLYWPIWTGRQNTNNQTKKAKQDMDIDRLTVGEVKQLKALLGGQDAPSKRLPMPLGAHVFIRTVTHYYTGKVIAVSEEEVQLSDAAWIADTGRFAESMREFNFSEVEPYPDGHHPILNRSSFIEWGPGPKELPRTQK